MSLVFHALPAQAEQLSELLPKVLKSHDSILASQAGMIAAKERIRESRGDYFPGLNVSAHMGAERIDKPFGSADTGMVTREVDLTVTQLLWDFGLTRSNVQSAKLTHEKAGADLRAARQDLILRAITAYLEVKKSAAKVEFAKQ
ncbi:MAG: TolC family protein, partial [Rhodospirillales bacterium]|nr:TolC family protein [Rhodospirillales bacterium]